MYAIDQGEAIHKARFHRKIILQYFAQGGLPGRAICWIVYVTKHTHTKERPMLYRLSLRLRLLTADRIEARHLREALRRETRAHCARRR